MAAVATEIETVIEQESSTDPVPADNDVEDVEKDGATKKQKKKKNKKAGISH